jgi:glycosyltransferase XagB
MPPLSPSDRGLGDLLVARGILTLGQLDEAVALAERWNVRLGDAVLARNWVAPETLYRGLAYHFDLPFVDLIGEPPDPRLLVAAEAETYAGTLTVPWRRRDGVMLIATAEPGPDTVLFARRRWGPAVEFVVASKFDIVWTVQTAFADALSHRAVFDLADRDPVMSARRVFTLAQAAVGYGLVSAFLAGLALAPIPTLVALNAAMSVFYLGNFLFKGVLVSIGGGRSADNDEAIAVAARALREEELPVFTVLVPMFREARMLPMLADALRKLDYPLGKLDIKIVLEADDEETIEVARTLGLEGVFEVIRVPPSLPQTKPKACNFALRFARGEYLVIYDAEDRPEPDQLRKVVATFQRSSPNTACLQCRLNYYNADENWLTRMFTLDYSLWFDQVLPGLERLNVPIPLGGTSNHFKVGVLRELHAWDPFNVTEDADLGIRLTQKGYRVGVVDSTTFEEASCHAGNFIRQRSRWIKGYMQTFLVHTRRPLHLMRTTGPLGFLGFVFFVGGTPLSGLLNPIFWALYLIWLAASALSLDPVFPQVVLFISLFNLLAGNGAFIYLSMLAPIRRGWLKLIPYGLTGFAYWVLISIAAYKGLWQLLRHPFYWEKTRHGVSKHFNRELEHDPEKPASDLVRGGAPVFGTRSCSNNNLAEGSAS